MGLISKLIVAPIRLLNVPARVMEKLVAKTLGDDDIPKEDRGVSAPLAILADTIEQAINGEDD